jgi:hypothetical protein
VARVGGGGGGGGGIAEYTLASLTALSDIDTGVYHVKVVDG